MLAVSVSNPIRHLTNSVRHLDTHFTIPKSERSILGCIDTPAVSKHRWKALDELYPMGMDSARMEAIWMEKKLGKGEIGMLLLNAYQDGGYTNVRKSTPRSQS